MFKPQNRTQPPQPDHDPGLSEGSRGPDRRKPRLAVQRSLFCSCGQATPVVAGLCHACYRRRRYSARFFGGNRDSALERDGRACSACQARHYLNVHHRHAGDHTQLVTLCAGCHARVHRTRILGRWLPEILVALWREWHPDAVEQLQLPLEMSAVVAGGAGWQIFSRFPARIVADPVPEDEPDGSGKSRVFFRDLAQASFDWSRETSAGGPERARVG